jgi:beta-lactamase regulating signal transducer with metallopeptidase domain
MIALLGWSLVHFVWQGAAAALLLVVFNRLFREAAPALRYVAASATLALMLALPVATFAILKGAAASPVRPTVVASRASSADGHAVPASDRTDAWTRGWERTRRGIDPFLPAGVALWTAGVVLLSLRSLGGWWLVRRLRRSGLAAPDAALAAALARLSRALQVSAPVRLWRSALVQVPTVVGVLRPVILVPASALVGLSPEQIELILAHELAHVRRLDFLVNLLQTGVETLLFYHPAVWWVSHRMRVEREHCCDDLAVAACGDRVRYARALADLEDVCAGAPALALAATGGSLFERIARLLAPAPRHVSPASRGLTLAVAGGLLAVLFGAGLSPAALIGHPASAWAAAASSRASATPHQEATEAMSSGGEENSAQDARPAGEETPASPAASAKPRTARQTTAEARAFPLERILELARAGVTPEYIDAMDKLGYSSLTAEQLVELRSEGVGPEYVHELADAGYVKLSPGDLVSLRSQGVSGGFVRELREQGLTGLSLTDLVELRNQGVSAEFVAALKSAGYTGLTPAKLVEVRSHGVSGAYIADMKALGYEKVPLERLVETRDAGVTPEFVRGLDGLGYHRLDIAMLVELRNHGVSPEYVRALQAHGYSGLSAETLVEMRDHGVTPEFVAEMKDAGYTGLKPDELISLRDNGVGPELLKRLRSRK